MAAILSRPQCVNKRDIGKMKLLKQVHIKASVEPFTYSTLMSVQSEQSEYYF